MRTRILLLILASITLIFSCTGTLETSSIESPPPLIEQPVPEATPEVDTHSALSITWEQTAEQWKGMFGHRQEVTLPPGGSPSYYSGMGSFTWDSSIGTAAVSMGLLNYEEGGTVTIEIKEGPYHTKDGTAFDTPSNTYEGWNTTFVFIDVNGEEVLAELGTVLYIPEEGESPQPSSAPQPTHFTVTNKTNSTLTYLDIFTNDMMAVDEFGFNLLQDMPLGRNGTIDIPLEEYPDLKEAILYRYGQMFHVIAESETMETYYRQWYPDFDTLNLMLKEEHLYLPPTEEASTMQMVRVENQTDYEMYEIYILTPEMEENLDFTKELLWPYELPPHETVEIPLDQWHYIQDFLETGTKEPLLVIAYDEDDFMLVTSWYPEDDGWTILLTEEDYFDW